MSNPPDPSWLDALLGGTDGVEIGLSEGFLSHPTWFPFRVSCSFPYNTL